MHAHHIALSHFISSYPASVKLNHISTHSPRPEGKKSDSFSPPIKSALVILFSNVKRGCFLVFGKRTYFFQFTLAVLLNDFSELLFKAFFAKNTEVERVVSSVQSVLKSSLQGLFTT